MIMEHEPDAPADISLKPVVTSENFKVLTGKKKLK
jgi:hypothetical protein